MLVFGSGTQYRKGIALQKLQIAAAPNSGRRIFSQMRFQDFWIIPVRPRTAPDTKRPPGRPGAGKLRLSSEQRFKTLRVDQLALFLIAAQDARIAVLEAAA